MESKVYIDPYPKTMKMLGLERINIDCGNNTSIVTPANIAKDMVTLLPDDVFIPESKFLDICCKSGIFLTSIREKLMNSPAMIEAIPDYKERYKYITNNQLFGIAPNGQCQMYSVRAIYGTLKVDNPHILCFGAFDQYRTVCLNNNHKMLIDEMKKEFGTVKFDVVIGNPPYNNDMYIDFLLKLKNSYNNCMCMITPAKFYFTKKDNNLLFDEIYKYISKCVFYQCEGEIFKINMAAGIAYYIIQTSKTDTMQVKNCSDNFSAFEEDWKTIDKNSRTFNIKAIPIIQKIGINRNNCYKIDNNKLDKKYKCNVRKQAYDLGGSSNKARGVFYYDDTFGNAWVTNNFKIEEEEVNCNGTISVYSADSIDECKSFISYINTRLVRYLLAIGISGYSNIMCNDAFRFVPAPEAFDHIFTDQELYKKYNLTDEEINIIESVIKERK